jgi:hypothetical protein
MLRRVVQPRLHHPRLQSPYGCLRPVVDGQFAQQVLDVFFDRLDAGFPQLGGGLCPRSESPKIPLSEGFWFGMRDIPEGNAKPIGPDRFPRSSFLMSPGNRDLSPVDDFFRHIAPDSSPWPTNHQNSPEKRGG